MSQYSPAVAKALKAGDWKEFKDPKGKTYFFNKSLNKTVWDLEKELQVTASAPTTTPAATLTAAPTTPNSTQRKDFGAIAQSLVASGVWQEHSQQLSGGLTRVFYQHKESGETTRDLGLYLEIMDAIEGDDAALLDSTTPSLLSSDDAVLQDKAQMIVDAQDVVQVDEWVALFLHRTNGGEDEIAARRLLQQTLQRTGQWDHIVGIEKQVNELQQKLLHKDAELGAKESIIQAQQRELEQLRKRTYFHPAGEPPQTRGEQSTTISNLEEQVRRLTAALDDERRKKHDKSTCPTCVEGDPWRRLVDRPVTRESLVPSTPTSVTLHTSFPKSSLLTAAKGQSIQQKYEQPTFTVLPSSLTSPSTRDVIPLSTMLSIRR